MTRRLDVYLRDVLVGQLEQTPTGRMRFRYAPGYLQRPAPISISRSLPLRPAVFNDGETRPFFAGLLPEADKRRLIARQLGVSPNNDFALLDRIGGECAGAITFVRAGQKQPVAGSAANYRPLDDEQLAKLLADLPRRPLLVGEKGVRLSLAGVQDKLPVLFREGRLSLPLDGAPSSHILKPPIPHFEDTVENEAFCLRLASAAGLHAVEVTLGRAGLIPLLLVKRYDREPGPSGSIVRLHQEDFCQALGLTPEQKYEAEQGPSLKDCFELVRQSSARPALDLVRLLDAVLFNLLVGNNDAHGKNFSLLYRARGIELAPLYDLTSTAVYPELSQDFAMKIGGARHFPPGARHWEKLAAQTGLGPAQVRRRIAALASILPKTARELADAFPRESRTPLIERIVRLIEKRATSVLDRLR